MTLKIKNKVYAKIAIFFLSGTIMIGHGARMIYQGVFQKGSYYSPNTFDIFFDWASLLILGFIIIVMAFLAFYHTMERKQLIKNNKSEGRANPS